MAIAPAPFEALPEAVKALGRRRLMRLSKEGRAPPYVRLSAYSAPLWSEAAIRQWTDEKTAPLALVDDTAPAADRPAAGPAPLIPMYDGEPGDPRTGEP
jgi:predicted DNA-binding transcriptional regulator AlpA